MFCQQCGRELPINANFCQGCGKPVGGSLLIDGNRYGGFWIRWIAATIDGVFLLIPTLLISFLYRNALPAEASALVEFIIWMALLMIWWVYTAAFHSSPMQATPGKRLLGLRLIDYEGNRVSFARASGRYFASFLSGVLLCVG